MFLMVLVGSGSVSFDKDPDSGSSHFFIRIRIQGNDTNSTDPDPPHCRKLYLSTQNHVLSTTVVLQLEQSYLLICLKIYKKNTYQYFSNPHRSEEEKLSILTVSRA